MYSGSLVTDVDSVDNEWVTGIKSLDGSGEVGVNSWNPVNASGRWANHSRDFNAKMLVPAEGLYHERWKFWFVYLYSTKNILPGDEIFVDYGKNYFTRNGVVDPTYYT